MNRAVASLSAALALAVGLAAAPDARAQQDVDVSINTASLAGEAGSELFVELTGGGSDAGIGYNKVTMSDFVLGGGAAGPVDTLNSYGDVTGDLGSTVSLDDNGSPDNVFGQYLTPGSALSFQMAVTGNANTGATPDGLFLFLYDPSGNPIANTEDPSGFDSLLSVNFDSPTPAITSYPNVDGTNSVSVTAVGASAAPEIDPSSAVGALTLLAGLIAVMRGRRNLGNRGA
ncbi:MAG TPA: hypothetical protein VMD56_05625 [Steroidobacteraceae bacterium]|nr:hypothetical protein [Steroidobacteraceae bacterium]